MRITTCIPRQKYSFKEKFSWLEKQLKSIKTDIFVSPQEYFGGDYIMPKETSFTKKDLLPKLEKMSKTNNKAIIISVIEKITDDYNQEKMWFIDRTFKGEIVKFAEPNYTVLGTGSYKLKPEVNLTNRLITFKIKNINVAGFFCWEVFSDSLMAGLGILEPDLVVSQIKFGVAGYPTYTKNEFGLMKINKIVWCPGDVWIERLNYASMFELMTPIVCSTNSWNLRAKFRPLVGTYFPYKKMEGVVVTDNKLKDDILSTDEINFDEVRKLKSEWYSIPKRERDFPSSSFDKYIMLFKMHKITKRLILRNNQNIILNSHFDSFTYTNTFRNKIQLFKNWVIGKISSRM